MPKTKLYTVQVTLTAEIEAADTAIAAAEVLHELHLRCSECTLVVTMVYETDQEKVA